MSKKLMGLVVRGVLLRREWVLGQREKGWEEIDARIWLLQISTWKLPFLGVSTDREGVEMDIFQFLSIYFRIFKF